MLTKVLLVGLGGFLGANARYWLGGWIISRTGPLFPWHTMVINVSGSFLLGLLLVLSQRFPWSPGWSLAVAVGFLGSYTTFSTFEMESLNLLSEGSLGAGLANMFGSLAAGLIAAWLGVVLGRFVTEVMT